MSVEPTVDFKLLTVEQQEFAASNLNELEEIRDEKIEEIRQWILNSKDLCARTGNFLKSFYYNFEFKIIYSVQL